MSGKAILIVVLGIMSISYVSYETIMTHSNESSKTIGDYYFEQQAYNISQTGINMTLKKLDGQPDWRRGFYYKDLFKGLVNVQLKDTVFEDKKVVKINSTGIMGYNTRDEYRVTSIAYVKQATGYIPAALMGAVTSNTNIKTSGKLIIDGRDHDMDGNLIDYKGSYAVWTTGEYDRKGNSRLGSTYDGTDYAPAKVENDNVRLENQTWGDGEDEDDDDKGEDKKDKDDDDDKGKDKKDKEKDDDKGKDKKDKDDNDRDDNDWSWRDKDNFYWKDKDNNWYRQDKHGDWYYKEEHGNSWKKKDNYNSWTWKDKNDNIFWKDKDNIWYRKDKYDNWYCKDKHGIWRKREKGRGWDWGDKDDHDDRYDYDDYDDDDYENEYGGGKKDSGTYPKTPEEVLGGSEYGFSPGKLKEIAKSGRDGSQYVTNPKDLENRNFSGVTYVELDNKKKWNSVNISGSGILIVHNDEGNALLKNLNKGTFKGIIIVDDIQNVHTDIYGAIFTLTSKSKGNILGNGNGQILFSNEAISNAVSKYSTKSNTSETGDKGVVAWWN